jgi:hypothetical protein
MNLGLPRTIWIDLFFKILPEETLSLHDEGLKYTGKCDVCGSEYAAMNDLADVVPRHSVDNIAINALYCKDCGGDLF